MLLVFGVRFWVGGVVVEGVKKDQTLTGCVKQDNKTILILLRCFGCKPSDIMQFNPGLFNIK